MRIDKISKDSEILGNSPGRVNNDKKDKKDEFVRYLEESMNNGGASRSDCRVLREEISTEALEILLGGNCPVKAYRTENGDAMNLQGASKTVEGFIEEMDGFCDILSSPSFNPKEFDTKLRDLYEKSQNIGCSQDISEEIRILLFTESVKWKRGDYL